MKKKDPPQNPVLDHHVAEFDEYIKKWRELLNLRNWRVSRAKKREPKAMAALISVEHEHRLARYSIGVDFGAHEVNGESLESTALHELLHLLLRPLIDVAVAEGENNDAVLTEEHSIITVLEALLLHAYKEDYDGTDKGKPAPEAQAPVLREAGNKAAAEAGSAAVRDKGKVPAADGNAG